MSNDNRITEVRSTQKETGTNQRMYTFKATQLVWLAFGILEGLIALRIIFKLIAANPDSPIAQLLYGFTGLFLFPFAGLTGTPASGGMILEISSVIAMIVYALIGWAIAKAISVIFYTPRGPVVGITETTTSEHHTNTNP